MPPNFGCSCGRWVHNKVFWKVDSSSLAILLFLTERFEMFFVWGWRPAAETAWDRTFPSWFFSQRRRHVRNLVIFIALLLHYQIEKGIWFVHCSRLVLLESFVKLYWTPCSTGGVDLWTKRYFMPCLSASFSIIHPFLRPSNQHLTTGLGISLQDDVS